MAAGKHNYVSEAPTFRYQCTENEGLSMGMGQAFEHSSFSLPGIAAAHGTGSLCVPCKAVSLGINSYLVHGNDLLS